MPKTAWPSRGMQYIRGDSLSQYVSIGSRIFSRFPAPLTVQAPTYRPSRPHCIIITLTPRAQPRHRRPRRLPTACRRPPATSSARHSFQVHAPRCIGHGQEHLHHKLHARWSQSRCPPSSPVILYILHTMRHSFPQRPQARQQVSKPPRPSPRPVPRHARRQAGRRSLPGTCTRSCARLARVACAPAACIAGQLTHSDRFTPPHHQIHMYCSCSWRAVTQVPWKP